MNQTGVHCTHRRKYHNKPHVKLFYTNNEVLKKKSVPVCLLKRCWNSNLVGVATEHHTPASARCLEQQTLGVIQLY
jgi:hypothetical protein